MAKALTPAELYDRINKLFIDLYDIQEKTVKEMKDIGVAEETARILANTVIRQQIYNYLERLYK